jgi:hypothetical protein
MRAEIALPRDGVSNGDVQRFGRIIRAECASLDDVVVAPATIAAERKATAETITFAI